MSPEFVFVELRARAHEANSAEQRRTQEVIYKAGLPTAPRNEAMKESAAFLCQPIVPLARN
jgi:hypothetical protein